MGTRIFRGIAEPDRTGLSHKETWSDADRGLIKCWEVGRELAKADPELSEKAKNDELPVLGWKGGIAKKIKKKHKFGTLYYLAMWQGLRGEDLDVDLESESEHVCTRTGLIVTFTGDSNKYMKA